MEHNTNTPPTTSNEIEFAMGLSAEERQILEDMKDRSEQKVAKSTAAVLGETVTSYTVDSSGNVLTEADRAEVTNSNRG